VETHRSRVTEGWDFCPRLPHLGIWRSVGLEVTGRVRIADVHARTGLSGLSCGGPADPATVAVRVALSGSEAGVRVSARLSLAGEVVAEGSAAGAAGSVVELELRIPEPRRWWTNGEGEQPLYRLEVEAWVGDRVSDRRKLRLGLRSVELVDNVAAPPGSLPYTLAINGRRVFLRGWNWVPVDAMFGVARTARLQRLIELARAARVNLLRVWGGGLIESDAFYDACDEAGILVWQEFVLSSSGMGSTPSTDARYLGLLETEAVEVVRLRRNHPSLGVWCGGNELTGPGDLPLDERHPAIRVLRGVVDAHDPGRPWLPTSPSGPRFHFPPDDVGDTDLVHDVHGPWEHQGLVEQRHLWTRPTALLHSEFGAEGMTSPEVLEATIARRYRWPPTRANAVWRHRGDWWINEPLVQASFGGGLADLDTLGRASRYLQADGLATAVEAIRRGWPRTSGSIPWQLNETYPNAWSTAAVDWSGRPKPAYHAVAAAYRPMVAVATFRSPCLGDTSTLDVELWAWSEQAVGGVLLEATVRAADGSGVAAEAWTVDLRADRTTGPIAWSVPIDHVSTRVLCLDAWVGGATSGRTRSRTLLVRAAHLGPLLSVAPARLAAAPGDGGVVVTNTGSALAVSVTISSPPPGPRLFDDPDSVPAAALPDAFHLLPGERQEVRILPARGQAPDERLLVRAWNADVVRVRSAL
jgi:beta-mannosidase